MNNEEIIAVDEIKERWKNDRVMMCEYCIGQAIRHLDRNMDLDCDSTDKHPGRYDGDILANAGNDIDILLNIIDKLQNQ